MSTLPESRRNGPQSQLVELPTMRNAFGFSFQRRVLARNSHQEIQQGQSPEFLVRLGADIQGYRDIYTSDEQTSSDSKYCYVDHDFKIVNFKTNGHTTMRFTASGMPDALPNQPVEASISTMIEVESQQMTVNGLECVNATYNPFGEIRSIFFTVPTNPDIIGNKAREFDGGEVLKYRIDFTGSSKTVSLFGIDSVIAAYPLHMDATVVDLIGNRHEYSQPNISLYSVINKTPRGKHAVPTMNSIYFEEFIPDLAEKLLRYDNNKDIIHPIGRHSDLFTEF